MGLSGYLLLGQVSKNLRISVTIDLHLYFRASFTVFRFLLGISAVPRKSDDLLRLLHLFLLLYLFLIRTVDFLYTWIKFICTLAFYTATACNILFKRKSNKSQKGEFKFLEI